VHVKVNILLNGANFGTAPLISLPVTAVAPSGVPLLGIANYVDTSATIWALGFVLHSNTTQVAPVVAQPGGTSSNVAFNVSAAVPFTWAAGDQMTLDFGYEAA
jgi:hypothetical protein